MTKEEQFIELLKEGDRTAREMKELLDINSNKLMCIITILSYQYPIYEYWRKGDGVVYGLLRMS